jgi:hypothetical protein
MSTESFRAALLRAIPPERIARALEQMKEAGAITPSLQRAIEETQEKPTRRVFKFNGKQV